jgi:hypothetical protein
MKPFRHWETKNFHRLQLEQLCVLLDSLPRERFNYSVFVGARWKGMPDLSCGTTACAFGWATTMPSVKAMGIKMEKNGSGLGCHPRFSVNGVPSGAFAAACVAFGLDGNESEYLFRPNARLSNRPSAPSHRATATEVSAHIRQFLTWKRWPGEPEALNV